ncbi:hypothetical protein FA15DRAFT_692469 [Coprinopsis marcescibilis]|uniref:Uncharacterized protein n=1 Tax=Coprinopsis marcescibilis TaxID=230819 RepID=A0A5C3L481_COPMA|nr:hypothetical protein FA15DRAFT_692469 [Coprinopsis marcescibilis]
MDRRKKLGGEFGRHRQRFWPGFRKSAVTAITSAVGQTKVIASADLLTYRKVAVSRSAVLSEIDEIRSLRRFSGIDCGRYKEAGKAGMEYRGIPSEILLVVYMSTTALFVASGLMGRKELAGFEEVTKLGGKRLLKGKTFYPDKTRITLSDASRRFIGETGGLERHNLPMLVQTWGTGKANCLLRYSKESRTPFSTAMWGNKHRHTRHEAGVYDTFWCPFGRSGSQLVVGRRRNGEARKLSSDRLPFLSPFRQSLLVINALVKRLDNVGAPDGLKAFGIWDVPISVKRVQGRRDLFVAVLGPLENVGALCMYSVDIMSDRWNNGYQLGALRGLEGSRGKLGLIG